MKKKILFMLPCIAAVAIATFVGAKALKSNAGENSLLMENVEAISQTEPGHFTKIDCYKDIALPGAGTYTFKCSKAKDPDIDECSDMDHLVINENSGKCLMRK